MILKFLQQILLHRRVANGSTADPIQNTPGSKISIAVREQMHINAACNAAQEEAGRHDCVSGICKSLLYRDHCRIQKIGEHVEAEEHSRRIGWNKSAEQVGERVVIMRGKREWSLELMIPRPVIFRHKRGLGVKHVAMQDIGKNLEFQRTGKPSGLTEKK